MTNKTLFGKNFFARIFFGLFRGSAFGILGGFIAGAIGSLVYWIITKYTHQSIYEGISYIQFVFGDALGLGIPIGFIIGSITGLHSEFFKNFCPKPLVWIILSSFSVIAGLWISGLSPNNLYAYFLNISILSLMTSWFVNKFTMHESKGDKNFLRFLYIGISSVSSSLLILIAVYKYFKFLLYAMSVPS